MNIFLWREKKGKAYPKERYLCAVPLHKGISCDLGTSLPFHEKFLRFQQAVHARFNKPRLFPEESCLFQNKGRLFRDEGDFTFLQNNLQICKLIIIFAPKKQI